eukprot:m.478038 g.478038  ORF g.478038 m.478038 type:complete len:62 (+) comp45467_c0_seq1:188-373(+)
MVPHPTHRWCAPRLAPAHLTERTLRLVTRSDGLAVRDAAVVRLDVVAPWLGARLTAVSAFL